ncbi:hypothetical protein ANSO36C_67370 (plasmid) [Nostoc cf. commune SO-36]|uniref:DNA methylase adenine-specific domain-containing protein n=1 Tax=Nostoc cf. commune SO-36 TaxID=449208 RepID=A0ABM7ZCC3_NOSCO|nr:hypothetical protein [Nostoc commune]BDI20935.1 hypothetical protein ANSO36C_67370 [Nostoc cf. commune SO-36]
MVLKSTVEHGWLLSKLLKLDDEYQGRWEQWRWTMETGELPKEIPQTEFLDLGHPQVLQMLSSCLQSISTGGCGSPSRFIPYFTDWLLYALGHPSIAKLPHEPEGCNGASNRLIQELELKLLISCPFDYFGHLLAANGYGQSRAKFYPTPTWTARTMAIAAVDSSAAIAPFHIYEPALGTGRLALEMSNYAISLTGWECDLLLIKIASLNFMLYAPYLALPIPSLGGDLVIGDTLTGKGISFIRANLKYETPASTPKPKLNNSLLINGIKYENTKAENMLQGSLF